MSKNLLLIAVACGALVFTNPEKSEFVKFLNHQMIKSMDEASPNLGKEAKTFATGLMSMAIEKSTEQKDYFIFSILKVDTSFLRLFNNDVPDLKFIGVAGQFIPYGKTLDFLQQVKDKQTMGKQSTIKQETLPTIEPKTPKVSLDKAAKAIEGEIDYSHNQTLLRGIFGFEKRYPAFDTPEGQVEVQRLNNLIENKINQLN